MAASKSVSRKAAAKKASKMRTPRAAVKKAAKTRKQGAAGKKAAPTRKGRAAAKKALAPRKTKAALATRAKTAAKPLSAVPPAVADIDGRIAIVRNNLRELVEQATSYSGAASEELMSQRIADQEARLELLMKQREELSQRGS